MNKNLEYKKGFLLKIHSQENDGDFKWTREAWFKTKERAILIKNLLEELFISCWKHDEIDFDAIEKYRQSVSYFNNNYDKNSFIKFISKIYKRYLGKPVEEDYEHRECDSCELYEIKEDVTFNIIPTNSWNFRVISEDKRFGGLSIHEVHYEHGDLQSCTENPVTVGGDTIDDIKKTLELMSLALEKPILNKKRI